jgi:peptidoglycan/xylan/chitin deacetylase (PgdA/CDA1 family)
MKIMVLKKKTACAAACILALCAAVGAVAVPALAGAWRADRKLPIYCVDTRQKACAISFDAAWGDVSTKSLVKVLNRYKVKATFFVIGKWAEQYPDDVKMLQKNGMEIMSHSYAHDHMTKLSDMAIAADLERCGRVIETITGKTPTLFRCPYGDYDDHVVNAVRSCGLEPIQWDVEGLHRIGACTDFGTAKGVC